MSAAGDLQFEPRAKSARAAVALTRKLLPWAVAPSRLGDGPALVEAAPGGLAGRFGFQLSLPQLHF